MLDQRWSDDAVEVRLIISGPSAIPVGAFTLLAKVAADGDELFRFLSEALKAGDAPNKAGDAPK